ncbi:ogr/Delta-like zinc finger family protein [Halodesulfovibrio sp. MK-HDV]|uniref:ogr/Delta-like zinc finger family protein n=1 Tax=Halodesulfovibrio sp. MK-HDV TaxID=2599925 RepID=UPI00136EB52E|nr:ogr/Delta-like zinc finger family protein [Halodesulfovibrio sp. MK-HDV]KAF1073881.1 hypothetical protein MKHDV_03221 [Halodesulfovibrio sp. MK-HDV]
MNKKAIVTIIAQAKSGVDYGTHGAICPCCGKRARVHTTKKSEGGIRIRYHKCKNPDCLLQQIGVDIKSVQCDEAA